MQKELDDLRAENKKLKEIGVNRNWAEKTWKAVDDWKGLKKNGKSLDDWE